MAVTGLLLGLVSKSAGDALTGSTTVSEVLARLGARGSGARVYLGVAFLVVALLVALVAAGQATAARDEEASGRLDALLARPVSRRSWLLARVGVAVVALLVLGVVAALTAWAGAASQGSGIGIGTLLQAGVNLVPPALVVLGVGVLAHRLWPRGVAATTNAQLAAAAPDWAAAGVLIVAAASAASVGLVAFLRRDITGE